MDDLQVTRYGSNAVLVRFADRVGDEALARCRGLMRHLAENPPDGLRDATPAYCSLLLEFDTRERRNSVFDKVQEDLRSSKSLAPGDAKLHEIAVRYDGEDLAALAESSGLKVTDIVELHSAPVYDVYMIGFSPGFPYLGPLNPGLHAPRRQTPRPRVPAGSVAIGGEHTGIYSIASPGGWHLIGNTDAELFSRTEAACEGSEGAFLLNQGDRVKFLPVSQ